MKKSPFGIACVGLSCLLPIVFPFDSHAEEMTREEVIAVGERVADAQVAAIQRSGRRWEDGVMWAGIMDFSKISEKGYQEIAYQKLRGNKGQLMFHNKDEPHHADDFCIGMVFMDLHEQTSDPVLTDDLTTRLDAATVSIMSEEMAQKVSQSDGLAGKGDLTWYRCEALFMAAPVHARLSAMLGDPKYREAMHVEWQRVYDRLYDKDEHLYYRDAKCLNVPSMNGQKTFWSRGNGWVMAALARTIPYIPEDDPKRLWYVDQFREMADKLASLQRPDGTWSPSLLDYEEFPYSESSGTALNAYAMAWGINNDLLEEKTFRPVVEKAWSALMASLREDGRMGYVQGGGGKPAPVNVNRFAAYGNGIFLMAAAQLAEMAPLRLPPSPQLVAISSENK